jgi:hypothetical protein
VGVFAALPVVGRAGTMPAFATHLVSSTLAGGEPLVIQDLSNTGGPDLAYTSHEGTTHLFRDGLVSPDTSNICSTPQVPPQQLPSGFACSYTNEVNVWTSTDDGTTWQQTTAVENGIGQTGVNAGPTSPFGLGFSDPDWTTDEGGYLYNTGIDLANDAVFASQDGGRTFPIGNNNCHSGDRPWLAGGVSGEVFLATDTEVDPNTNLSSGHEIFHGLITGAGPAQTLLCYGTGDPLSTPDITGTGSTGIADYGTASFDSNTTYGAAGKLLYDHNKLDVYHGALIDPVIFSNPDRSTGVGISILPNAAQAFSSGVTKFPQQYEVPLHNGEFSHWPALALDSNDIVYIVWDSTAGGSSALDNGIYVSTFDLKDPAAGWTTPIAIATPQTSASSKLWPWIAAADGNAAVVWYQYDEVTNPDQTTTGNVRLYETTVLNATTASPTLLGPVDAAGEVIHSGGTCQEGTTCVATGQDRRLGDFFTDSLDSNGCVLIASGETVTDPTAATSRPIFLQQTSGPSLTGGVCGSPLATTLPETPAVPALFAIGAVGIGAGWYARRRRSRRLVP